MERLANLLITSNGDQRQSDVSGINRSIVRRIGSQLPLPNAPRPTFELLPNGSNVLRSTGKKPTLFSLADVILLDDVPENHSVCIRPSASAPNLNESMQMDAPVAPAVSTTSVPSSASQDDVMVTKISALEDELASLRSQIAALVTNQNSNVSGFNASMSSTFGAPASSSTPIKAPSPPGVPPPPPPPPPPPTPSAQTDRLSVQDIIRQRKQGKGAVPAQSRQTQSQSSVPDMADILKDLHKVKLKSVARSPGGTPFNNKKIDSGPVDGDPASLIAAALRKKFAHRQNFESPKSEEQDDSFEPYTTKKNYASSPNQTPKFGQHLLKRRNTTPSPIVKPKPELPSFLKKQREHLENSTPATS